MFPVLHCRRFVTLVVMAAMTAWQLPASADQEANDPTPTSPLELGAPPASTSASTETYFLKYKFHPGEILRYRVEHMVTVDTRIAGNSQQTKSRTTSTKAWEIPAFHDDQGELIHRIEDVDMWQQSSGQDEIHYNSKTDTEIPEPFAHVAKSLHQPLAKVTVNASGHILTRESAATHPDLGFGGLIMPLPNQPIAIGQTWSVPDKVRLRERDGQVKQVLTRMQYRLEKVKTGVATISVRTQVLTPMDDNARLKSQLVQKLSNGEIKFDIESGRVLSKQLDWDEDVVGFNGPDSSMKYLARFAESLTAPDTTVAALETLTPQ